jgi:hypothetical protein
MERISREVGKFSHREEGSFNIACYKQIKNIIKTNCKRLMFHFSTKIVTGNGLKKFGEVSTFLNFSIFP